MNSDNRPEGEPAGPIPTTVHPDGSHSCPSGYTLVMADPDGNGEYVYACLPDHEASQLPAAGPQDTVVHAEESDGSLHPDVEAAIANLAECDACVRQCQSEIVAGIRSSLDECDAVCCESCGCLVGSIATAIDAAENPLAKSTDKLLGNIINALGTAQSIVQQYYKSPEEMNAAVPPPEYIGPPEQVDTLAGGNGTDTGTGGGGTDVGTGGGVGDWCLDPSVPRTTWTSPSGTDWIVSPTPFVVPTGVDNGVEVPQPATPLQCPFCTPAYWIPNGLRSLPYSYPCYEWATYNGSPVIQYDPCGQLWWAVKGSGSADPSCAPTQQGEDCCVVNVTPKVTVERDCTPCPKPDDATDEESQGGALQAMLYAYTGYWDTPDYENQQ